MTNTFFRRIAFENVTFGHRKDRPLWDNLSFEFPLGEWSWIRASFGAGVSSLLRMLAGILPPASGKYWLNDVDIYAAPFHALSKIRTKTGYGFDEGGLLSNLTLEGNLLLPLRYHGIMSKRESLERASFYLRELGLYDVKDLRPALTSVGMKRGCLLARALILEPELLILDDPTTGLHPETAQRLKNLLEWHRREKGLRHVFMASDDESFCGAFNPTVIELDQGRLSIPSTERRKSA